MTNRRFIFWISSLLALVLLNRTAIGQHKAYLFSNEKALTLVKNGAERIYSVDRSGTRHYIEETRKLLPKHPVVPMMEGMAILWTHLPVVRDSVFESFSAKMMEVIARAGDMDEDHPEAVFFEMSARGLLAEYYADQGSYISAVGEASQAYGLLKQGFKLTKEYPEFLFVVGIYNYFREAYPDKHPIVRPFMWFFKEGDKQLGIEQIKEASRSSVLSRVEANIYLAYIYLRYEEQPAFAQKFLEELLERYPENDYIKAKYLESLNIPGSYHKMPIAEIERLMDSPRLYYEVVGNVFKGIHLERVGEDPDEAFKFYNVAIGMGAGLESHGDHYKSLAYLGAGRILERQGKYEEANQYLRLAVLHAQTDEVMKEAKNLMR